LGRRTDGGRYPLPPYPAIEIIVLRAKTAKIFEFKGLIWKIFRNKDLAVGFYGLRKGMAWITSASYAA